MDNYVEQVKDINITRFLVALCNGTIKQELENLNNIQLDYLKSLIDKDDTIEDQALLLDYIGNEIRKRNKISQINFVGGNNYLTSGQLIERACKSIIQTLESYNNQDRMIQSLLSIETITLKNVKYYLSKKELSSTRQLIKDTIENELARRENALMEKENGKIKKLSL